MAKRYAAILIAMLLASAFAGVCDADEAAKLAELIQSKQCDRAEQYAKRNLKGSNQPMGLAWVELTCRNNKNAGIVYLQQSIKMGNPNAQRILDQLTGHEAVPTSQSQVSCDRVYGLDAMLDDQAKETQVVYNSHIERASNESFAATLAGAANQSFAGGMGAGMTASGAPYRARVNDLIAERDSKVRDIRNQQKKLRYENPSCYP